ncbi:glucose-6-phosphate dehydrogenase assembly protein OpcA [Synechococcus sp. ATX 2A4]|uniref:glucose-6-phosphate dehydrogenase assembly protein OpcA n=1 Tax=Synechococcus sp. ATX 2A4 TaxID=2823727 RepID=UPI0020CC7599|nr:glucose-6-phosphate dehydrogenase assembly protein OpcA [Synechococcus sp. ATX 2A4]MCP9884600.1 glucose-6-phosphate dehydrogenase assembly protein OpcA [Synechococcus sp. ATX 2A4]
MTPQLTLQAPVELPPPELTSYLEKLWQHDLEHSSGASTFTLLVWQPAWVEQHLVRLGRLEGPVTGVVRPEVLEAAREAVDFCGLPPSTSPLAPELAMALGEHTGVDHVGEDLRGQHVESAISAYQPRRLITLAPTLSKSAGLETLVAAYCPLSEEGNNGATCGDVVVLRGDFDALREGLSLLQPLVPDDLPCWVWWNGSLEEAPDLLAALSSPGRRLVIDSALGPPRRCLDLLEERVNSSTAVNDLNWLRLRGWRESLAMVFDPPGRRESLSHVVHLDIDVEGSHPVQGLLLAAWIADRLGWHFVTSYNMDGDAIGADFERSDGTEVRLKLMPVPVGIPSSHPGTIVGLRLICEPDDRQPLCVILCSETGGCMRLEAGGVARMELAEDVVPKVPGSDEMEMGRLLGGGHDSTTPLLAAAAPLAAKLLPH